MLETLKMEERTTKTCCFCHPIATKCGVATATFASKCGACHL